MQGKFLKEMFVRRLIVEVDILQTLIVKMKELWCLDRRGSCEEDPGCAGDEASGLQGHGPLRRLLHPVRLLLRLLQHALQVTTNTREKIFLCQKNIFVCVKKYFKN